MLGLTKEQTEVLSDMLEADLKRTRDLLKQAYDLGLTSEVHRLDARLETLIIMVNLNEEF